MPILIIGQPSRLQVGHPMNSADTITLTSFMLALSRLNPPLSEDLQQAIRKTGHDLENQYPGVADEIRDLVEKNVHLKEEYQAAYRTLQKQYSTQERTKNLALAATGFPGIDLTVAAQSLTADNPVNAAEQFIKGLKAQALVSTNKATVSLEAPGFWQRGDRLIALASGGAFLGGLLAQIPGAIVGGLLAGVFAWLSNDAKTSPGRNS